MGRLLTPVAENPLTALSEKCYHCGADCEDADIVHDHKHFCCEGCRLVYEILDENQLCTYYSLPDAKGNTPDKTLYKGKYAYLNLPEVRAKIVEFAENGRTSVNWYIPQMHCSSCIWLLENLSRLNNGVVSVTVNFPEKRARIVVSDEAISLGDLAALMASIGYEPYISLQDTEGKVPSRINKTRLYKIGIAGFAFGNIMLMSFPEYFSLRNPSADPGIKFMFSIVNLILALPVFFYSASDFFVSAWKAVRYRQLNIDAPIALAILVTFVRSVVEITTQTGAGYLDSMTGIVFFMLLGRYFQDKTYSVISFDRDYKSYFPVAVTVLADGKEKQKTVTALEPGERILIHNQELIPCDAQLISEEARVDYSFVSGESEPVRKERNETIYAGGRLVGKAAELEVSKRVSKSYLTQLWNNDAFGKKETEDLNTLTELINRYFTLAVFSIGLISWGFWIWNGDFKRGFDAMTTVWIVACPCALLLSDNFTNGNILSIFGRFRLYLKNAGVLDRLAKINTIIFDKTGTLTLPNSTDVRFVGGELTTGEKRIVYALTSQSGHPLSRLIKTALQSYGQDALGNSILDFREVPGQGIEASFGGKIIRVGSAAFAGAINESSDPGRSRSYVAFGGDVRGYFEMRSQYRANLEDSIRNLKSAGYEVYLLSGDKPTDQGYLTSVFGNASSLNFNQSPADKMQFVAGLQREGKKVMMLGDGLNDAGALVKSEVGIAVSDDINNFSPACHAVMEGRQLEALWKYIRLAKAGKGVIVGSFVISLIYNVVGLSFATQGILSPVVAAILMPASSLSIILFTTLCSNILAGRIMRSG